MTRRVPALAVLLLTAAFAAEPYRPTAQQLDDMLRGNTMEGIWAGRPYLQYFDPSGSTRYREQGGEETAGRWRIDANGQYCSVWPPSDRWVCYEVLVIGNGLYWKADDQYYPSEVKPGMLF